MADKYLKISITGKNAGTVINTVMMEPTDSFDPKYKWTKVAPGTPHPSIGHTTVHEPVEVKTGKATMFSTFKLTEASGGFTVSYDGNAVHIDCRQYDPRWLRRELTLLCRNGRTKGTLTYAGRDGVLHDEYCIVWNDANRILTALETLKE